jgi:hypothetical protein
MIRIFTKNDFSSSYRDTYLRFKASPLCTEGITFYVKDRSRNCAAIVLNSLLFEGFVLFLTAGLFLFAWIQGAWSNYDKALALIHGCMIFFRGKGTQETSAEVSFPLFFEYHYRAFLALLIFLEL